MSQIFTHIQVESPDFLHTAGQFLCRPISIMDNRSYTIENGKVTELPPESFLKKVMAVAFTIIFLRLALLATLIGYLLLKCSVTYQDAYEKVEEISTSVTWNGDIAEVSTKNFLLKPLEAKDSELLQTLKVSHQQWMLKIFNHNNQKLGTVLFGPFGVEGVQEGKAEIRVTDVDWVGPNLEDRSNTMKEILRGSIAYAKALSSKGVTVYLRHLDLRMPLKHLWIKTKNFYYPEAAHTVFVNENAGSKIYSKEEQNQVTGFAINLA